jgi:polygalacturonase
MVQKFGLNHEMSAEEQIRMTEFNIEKGDVFIYYHYRDGKITANQNSFKRKDLIGNSSAVDEMNNKEVVENALQQKQKKIHEMEIECHHQINAQEETAGTERDARTSKEKEIMSHRFNNDQEVIF